MILEIQFYSTFKNRYVSEVTKTKSGKNRFNPKIKIYKSLSSFEILDIYVGF